MTKQQYDEMFATKRALDAIMTAQGAGYAINGQELADLQNKHADFIRMFHNDAVMMTAEEAECFRLRYVLGLTYHNITMILYRGLKSETTARKKINRWFKRMGV